MAGVSKRLALVRDAIEIVLSRLATMPPSPEAEELRRRAEDCLQEANKWSITARVLGLHKAVARHGRTKS